MEWFKDYYQQVSEKAQTFMGRLIPVARRYWESQSGPDAAQVLGTLRVLEEKIDYLRIDTTWEITDLLDDDPMDEDGDGDTSRSG